MSAFERIFSCTGFDWDDGNAEKNWAKHRVSAAECEQVFFNHPLLAFPDLIHSEGEERFYILGQTNAGRRLFLVFTVRADLIRVISARGMTRKEQGRFDSHGQKES